MSYPDGTEINADDIIWWNEGANKGRIALIVDTIEAMQEWGVEEKGIFICCDESQIPPSCDMFCGLSILEEEGIGLVEDNRPQGEG